MIKKINTSRYHLFQYVFSLFMVTSPQPLSEGEGQNLLFQFREMLYQSFLLIVFFYLFLGNAIKFAIKR